MFNDDIGTIEFTIDNGQTSSDIKDLRGAVPVGFRADGWTAGNLSFNASFRVSGPLEEVVDDSMSPVVITAFVANKAVQMNANKMPAINRLQLVSSVAQGAERKIQVFVRRF